MVWNRQCPDDFLSLFDTIFPTIGVLSRSGASDFDFFCTFCIFCISMIFEFWCFRLFFDFRLILGSTWARFGVQIRFNVVSFCTQKLASKWACFFNGFGKVLASFFNEFWADFRIQCTCVKTTKIDDSTMVLLDFSRSRASEVYDFCILVGYHFPHPFLMQFLLDFCSMLGSTSRLKWMRLRIFF